MRYRYATVILFLLLFTMACVLLPAAQAALREEQVIYPSGSWQYANTNTRDLSVLPSESSWSYNVLIWRNLHWMRTPISIPSSWQSSKRVLIHIGSCAHYVKVYMNGNVVGDHLGPVAPYDVDVTQYVNWSGSNTLMLAVMDWTYMIKPGAIDITASIPGDASYAPVGSVQGPLPLAIWVYLQATGKLWTKDVRMQGVPKVRITDVFVKPSVRQWKLDVDLTLRNDDTVSHTFSIENYITKWNQTATEKSFTPTSVTLAAGTTTTKTVAVNWTNPILWNPNQPQLYNLVTTLRENSNAIDSLTTRFGFREFWIQKSADNTRSYFVLNGVRQNLRGESVWHALLGDAYVNTFIDWLKANNYNCVRMCSAGMESYYNLADEKGILSISESPFYFNQNYSYDATFWSRAQTCVTDQIKTWRNHPSIIIWSVENEVMLTTPGQAIGSNIYAIVQAAMALDPTRTVMCEGDGDLRTVVSNTYSPGYNVPVINIHNYDIAQPSRNSLQIMDFPLAAYVFGETTDVTQMPSYHWGTTMPDKSKPWYIGEFGPGCDTSSPHAKSFFTGDAAYVDLFGQAAGLMQAMGMNLGFQIDGMRYFDHICGIAIWDSYFGDTSIGNAPWIRAAYKPVTTRIKELTHNFFAGDTVARTLTVYNDDALVTTSFNLHWKLVSGSQDLLSGDWNFVSAPGFLYRNTLNFTAPATASRLNVNLVLELRSGGTLVDTMTQALSIFPSRSNLTVPTGSRVILYEPSGSVVANALTGAGIGFIRSSALDMMGSTPGLYIIGPSAIPSSVSSTVIQNIRNWITNGGTVLVYGAQSIVPPWLSSYNDQTCNYNISSISPYSTIGFLRAPNHPVLVYGAQSIVPPRLSSSYNDQTYNYNISSISPDSTIGFLRAPNHPVLANMTHDDVKWWASDHYLTSGGSWTKPSAGLMTAIIDTGGRNMGLWDSPLCEYREGKGQTLLCHLLLFEKLGQEPATRILLQNILNYSTTATSRPEQRGLGLMAGTGSATPTVLARIKTPYTNLKGQLASYTATSLASAFSAIIIDNDSAVWTEVSANRAKLQAYVSNGGRLILRKINSNLLSQANSLTGVSMTVKATQLKHPQLEKKTADPVMDGISNDDVFWAYQYYWRTQHWASAIVTDVITVTESTTVKGLLVEPNRTGTLQSDSGSSYCIGDGSRDTGVAITQPGYGLVRINPASGTGYYLVDQLLWDSPMEKPLLQKAQRYLATLLTHSMDN